MEARRAMSVRAGNFPVPYVLTSLRGAGRYYIARVCQAEVLKETVIQTADGTHNRSKRSSANAILEHSHLSAPHIGMKRHSCHLLWL